MTRRKNKEVTTRELNKKIEAISKHLEAIQETQSASYEAMAMTLKAIATDLREAQSLYAEWVENRRKEATQEEKKLQISLYYQSLVMGLLLGIFVELSVSYFMKTLEIFPISPWGWIVGTIISVVLVSIIISAFYVKIKSL